MERTILSWRIIVEHKLAELSRCFSASSCGRRKREEKNTPLVLSKLACMTVRLTHAFSSFIALRRALRSPPFSLKALPLFEDAVMDWARGGRLTLEVSITQKGMSITIGGPSNRL
jgi:hypothetical protein